MNNMRGSCNPYQRPSPQNNECRACPTAGRGSIPESPSVAMAYIPVQTDTETYDKGKALTQGTVFPVLDKPFTKSGCRR